jgi:hypothetical protein
MREFAARRFAHRVWRVNLGATTGATPFVTEERANATGARCRQCRKPIIWPGLCYTCATGLPRRLRPREAAVGEQQVQRHETSDQRPESV